MDAEQDPDRSPRAMGEGSPLPEAQHDQRRAAAYVAGDADAIREVDGWIRRQIETRYPVLRGEIEDLRQSVHLKLLQNLRRGVFGERSTLRTYVAAITHHTAIDRIRRARTERLAASEWAPESLYAPSDPYRTLAAAQEGSKLHAAVLLLPAACIDLWRMVFLERLSYATIGERLSVAPGTVKSRMWYCRQKLVAILDGLMGREVRKSAP